MDIDEIVKRSYKNCHAIGVNSIVFSQKDDGRLIRMFYTEPNHVLWKNDNVLFKDLSIAFHSHHCDIGITVVHGCMTNVTAEAEKEIDTSNITGWKFESQIKTGKGSFNRTGYFTLMDVKRQKLTNGSVVLMKADQLHTVYVEPGQVAAWTIHEGDGDPNYDSTCYSNSDLTQFNFEDHYKPISKEEVIQAMKWW